jgi:C-terminal processing protease CtpA/Prc
MHKNRTQFPIVLAIFLLVSMACQTLTGAIPTASPIPTDTPPPSPTPTPLPPQPVQPGPENPDEPVFIRGDIPYTSPFFLDTLSEAYVLLEDQAGFINRDEEFEFTLNSQAIGPIEVHPDDSLSYLLSLPALPQGTQIDLDNDGEQDDGVQVFALAYWSNTWGGPFLEERDGTGWSTAYASTITDPDQDNEIMGGTLIIWAPDADQEFPTGFGEDGLLFTEDDPVVPIQAGYNLVDLDEEPFRIYKQAEPTINLIEGELAVKDFSNLGYMEAFDALFEQASVEYPFTVDKDIDWEALYDQYAPQIEGARDDEDFFLSLHDFTLAIPDGHVGLSFNDTAARVFFERHGGSFGLILTELSDGRVIVTDVLPELPGERAGIHIGAEIIEWDGQPVSRAIEQTVSFFGPYSTEHHQRLEQVIFMTRVPPQEGVVITFQNQDEDEPQTVSVESEVEYDSLFQSIPSLSDDELTIPVEAEVLDESGLGYLRINTFSDDYNLIAQLWDRHINEIIDLEVPGVILDVRVNGGGSSGLASDIAGYFFEEELVFARRSYFNELSGEFEYREYPSRVRPAPVQFEGPLAVLVSPYCVSACEGFVYALAQQENTFVFGHYPTAGAFGEVGRGQYDMPGDFSMQFPTGRSETLDGDLLIEGVGVMPDVRVPITEESALGLVDAVLEAAVEMLLEELDQ